MSGFDYGRMQGTATRLMVRFKQGAVRLKRVTLGTPPNEWTPAPETVETWPLAATVKRLHQRYENGVLIVETGDMVTFAVPEVEPQITDKLVIDGAERVITNLTPIPPAGTVVAYKAWCAA
ncbi:hypothetical protein [Aminobacter sp. MDW-2]|uniref:hypothetical protein n=1 Tax=Aminobacter sp. MDW-2 TaxID=2666139 RepID=UPI0012B0B6AF|nr:hypothetical protein [Aminobacter sp. MDW-2]MRX33217.1 hypothetical protein [Aminobacter sp. MDW-2]QNH36839.1 hypothetical protein H5P29_13600 [Aminobacter sp. MDW-2]